MRRPRKGFAVVLKNGKEFLRDIFLQRPGLPMERGLEPASMPQLLWTVKRHKCRAPKSGRHFFLTALAFKMFSPQLMRAGWKI
jgi:hypothetical protein